MRAPLFAFGTLRDRDVLAVVLGREIAPGALTPAWLPERRVVRLPDETYPVLLPAPGESARGDLLHGLGEDDWARISFWESEEYALAPCRVRDARGAAIPALVCAEGEVMPGAVEPWTLAAWRAAHKDAFLDGARRYMALFGRMSLAEADREWARMQGGGGE